MAANGGPKKKRADMTPEEREAIRRADYLSAIRREQGRGGMVSNEAVRERLRYLMDEKGIPARWIAQRSGVTETMILAHYHGRRAHRSTDTPLTTCRWDVERKILGARFTQEDQYWICSVGTRRRIQALLCKGYPYVFLAGQLGCTNQVFHRRMVTDSRARVEASFAREVASLYDKLLRTTPEVQGVSDHGMKLALATAQRHGFAPDHTWDPDTIDDPDAIPEWTGACGTPEGYYIHLTENLRVLTEKGPRGGARRTVLCQPCVSARAGAEGVQSVTDTEGIISALREGGGYRDIAVECGVSTRTVQRVANELKKTGWKPNKTGPRPKKEES